MVLESRTEIKDFKIEKDEIVALTAGVVKLEILDEKWNGETYSMTAKIEANPNDITRAIEELRKHKGKLENIEKLQTIKDESLEQIREMQSKMQHLQLDLLKLNQDANANEGILNAIRYPLVLDRLADHFGFVSIYFGVFLQDH